MAALIGMVSGGVAGWLTGYFVMLNQAAELGTKYGVLVEKEAIEMAPTAPDTMLYTAAGIVAGLVFGGLLGAHGGKKPAMDVRKLSTGGKR